MTHSHIYKIFLPDQWQDFMNTGRFAGAPIDVQDGYIHLSTAAQAAETANKHFRGVGDIVIAEVRADKLGSALTYEVSRGGDLFPHLYAELNMDAVTRHWVLKTSPNGAYVMPDFKL